MKISNEELLKEFTNAHMELLEACRGITSISKQEKAQTNFIKIKKEILKRLKGVE